MKKSLLLCGTWVTGYLIHSCSPYIKALQTTKDLDEEHSFQEFIKQYNYSQPKIIDMLHSSRQKHFLHNMIVQNENAFNLFKVYLSNNQSNLNDDNGHQLHIVFNASENVKGNNNDVNSGLLATIIDNAFGQLSFLAAGFVPTATANLQVDYKKPIKLNEDYLITCEVQNIQGRKVFLKAVVQDSENNICSEANAIFLTVNWGGNQWKKMVQLFQNTRLFNQGIQKLFYNEQ
ncbi:unnamed protein product [Paramecium octaurelia]|uniref:Thioesterase domain-containing protein n=1 Tax=Paramecium octaurelia TaxID=43137 RepID=A0A8S1TA98_PAROT|nr:unnamed protein product [Paramecium octaurelia]